MGLDMRHKNEKQTPVPEQVPNLVYEVERRQSVFAVIFEVLAFAVQLFLVLRNRSLRQAFVRDERGVQVLDQLFVVQVLRDLHSLDGVHGVRVDYDVAHL